MTETTLSFDNDELNLLHTALTRRMDQVAQGRPIEKRPEEWHQLSWLRDRIYHAMLAAPPKTLPGLREPA